MRRISLIALLALAACGQDPTLVTPATFERPGSVAFVCVDVTASTLVERSRCEGVTGDESEDVALVGLVTQTASGEVGAIDFRTRRVLDADPRVPGFTFTRVGEFPSAIVVPPAEPGVTYVAAYGSRTVESYPTAIFLGDAVPRADVAPQEVGLEAAPTDMVLSPDGSLLYLALPGAGTIVPVPIQADRSLGMPGAGVAPMVPAELPAPMAGMATAYQLTCAPPDAEPVNLGTPPASDVRTEILAEGESAQPHRMVVAPAAEGVAAELLVADRGLPLIHRFAIGADGALTEQPPLAPGVPIRDLAVSPFVGATLEGGTSQGRARYLYAIDDTDQSVVVIDYDPDSDFFGAVLPVSFGNVDSDRLRLAGKANALDVIARDYDFAAPDYCEAPTGDEGPLDLRGVFLAVGLANGAMQIIDVVDLDAPCRGVACTPEATPADDADRFVYIQRHRPRVAGFIAEAVGTLGSPILTVDGVGRVADATTGVETIDGLVARTCPQDQQHVYGELICATSDPWALRAEVWTATYEGTIPGTTQLARIEGDNPDLPDTFVLEGGREILCDRGVLGRLNVAGLTPGVDPEAAYVGDTLVITREPPEAARGLDLCEPYFEPEDGTGREREAIEIPIRQAFGDRVVVELRQANDLNGLLECYVAFGEFVGISIRLEQAFLVSGAQTGFLHRVIADETTGACRVDTAGQPIDPDDPTTYRNGRAFNGTIVDPDVDPPVTEPAPYQNPFIAFTFDAIGVNEEARLQLNLSGTPTPFAIPVGARPGRSPVITIVEEVVYSPVDERLYVLDSNASALVQYEVGEFQVRNVFE